MIEIAEALSRVLATVPPVRAERAPLELAFGRVAAAPVASPVDVPPWDNSAMDGYAVRAADTTAAPITLRLAGTVGAGGVAAAPLVAGEAVAVMTGAPIPAGADAVVMVERTDGSRAERVRIDVAAKVGDHVRRRGEDVRTGAVTVAAGDVLTPARIGLLASLGLTDIDVARPPRVALLGTGDEIVRPGTALRPGQIWSSNHLSLWGLTLAAGALPQDHGTAPDDLDATVAALRGAAADADLVVTTGGVSMGHYDVVKDAFAALGAPIAFWKVNMKPGKPLAFGVLPGGPVLFGLPGNPVSCMVNFLQFVRPWIRRALGDPNPFLPRVRATVTAPLGDGPGRARLYRVTLRRSADGELFAAPAGSQSSGVLTAVAAGHGLCVVAPEAPGPVAGDVVTVQVYDWGFEDRASP